MLKRLTGFCFIAALSLMLSEVSLANQASKQDIESNNKWCDKPIDWAVKQGSRQFTKAMVRNLSREAQRMDKSKSAEQANVCIIVGLQKRRLPYEF